GENHRSIINQDGGFRSAETLGFIIQGLMVTEQEFEDWCEKMAAHTRLITNLGSIHPSKQGFQNTICYVSDQFQQQVTEYFLEFYGAGKNTAKVAELFHVDTIQNVHPYGDNNSYRSLYMNCTRLYQAVNRANHKLLISLTALPEFRKQGDVGYRTFTNEDIGSIVVAPGDFVTLFQENRTLLLRIKLRREQSARVFKIKSLE
ncbi:MAG: alpha/beta hydrolase, partial [Gammaproteobacteria bacterium]|nr:alpha/beta hydrolase [Gammaproteobacteria bacterium]